MCNRQGRVPETGAQRSRGSPRRAALMPALVALVVLWTGAPGAAQEPGPPAAAPVEVGQEEETALPQEEQRERRRKAMAMVYLVAGIGVLGITLIVLIVLGGHRLRQRVRSRTGRSPDLDPLWYLRSAGTRGGARPAADKDAAAEADDRGSNL